MRRAILRLLVSALAVVASACGGGEDQPTEPDDQPAPQLTTIEVSPDSAKLTALGDSQDYDATARDENGDALSGVDFNWSVSPDTVGTVDSDGTVTAEASGSATVEAEARGVTGAADLTVIREVASLEVTPDSATLTALGDTQDFDATATACNGDTIAAAHLSWTVSPDSMGSIDGDGTVTVEANGLAAVVAEAKEVRDSATLVVEQEVAAVQVSPDSARSEVIGGTVEFEATAVDRNEHPVPGREFTWASSDTTVAAVDRDGSATTRSQGSVSVTASVGNHRGAARLVVRLPSNRLAQDFAGPSYRHTKARFDVAASSNRVVIADVGVGVHLYSKAGSKLDHAGMREFFGDSVSGGGKSRVVFDPDTERFFVVGTTGPATDEQPGYFALFVSKTSNPSAVNKEEWHAFLFPMDHEQAIFDEAHPARPRVGVSEDAVVLESFMAESQGPGDPCFTRLVVLNKEKLLDDTVADSTEIDIGDSDNEYCPSLVPVKFSQGAPLFVAWTGELEVWGVQNPLTEPTLEQTVATGGSGTFTGGDPPDAPQPDTDQELINFRDITAQPVRAGDVVGTAGTKRVETDVGPRSGVQWVQLDVSNWPASVHTLESGLFYTEHYAVYPAIAGNEHGDFAVIYGRSSNEEYPSLYYRYADSSWPADSISGPQLLKKGEASLTVGDGRVPYGDYFGASLDPADRSAWLVGEYAIDHETVEAWVGKVAF